MLAHSFGRYYVVTKFILPMLDDLKLSPIKYYKECNYICSLDDEDNDQIIKDLLLYSAKGHTGHSMKCKSKPVTIQHFIY